MAKRTANKLLKPFRIAKALVSFHANGDFYTHPQLFLKNEHGDTQISVHFQAHRLDQPDPLGSANFGGDFRRPSDRFDFGYAYSACYAPRYEPGHSFGFGSLSAEPRRNEGGGLRLLARLADKIAATARDYNLSAIEPNCDLALWVASLEKLGVPVEILRFVGREQLDAYAWRNGLPESKRHPARDFYAARDGVSP